MSLIDVVKDRAAPASQRVKALRAALDEEGAETWDVVAGVMDETSEELRAAAKKGLKRKRAAPLFARRLTSREEPLERRRLAARALRHLQDERTVPALVVGLGDGDDVLRRECAHALAVFGAGHAVTPLCQALADSAAEVRYLAAIALRQALTPEALAALRAREPEETDPTTRDEIARSLSRAPA